MSSLSNGGRDCLKGQSIGCEVSEIARRSQTWVIAFFSYRNARIFEPSVGQSQEPPCPPAVLGNRQFTVARMLLANVYESLDFAGKAQLRLAMEFRKDAGALLGVPRYEWSFLRCSELADGLDELPACVSE